MAAQHESKKENDNDLLKWMGKWEKVHKATLHKELRAAKEHLEQEKEGFPWGEHTSQLSNTK